MSDKSLATGPNFCNSNYRPNLSDKCCQQFCNKHTKWYAYGWKSTLHYSIVWSYLAVTSGNGIELKGLKIAISQFLIRFSRNIWRTNSLNEDVSSCIHFFSLCSKQQKFIVWTTLIAMDLSSQKTNSGWKHSTFRFVVVKETKKQYHFEKSRIQKKPPFSLECSAGISVHLDMSIEQLICWMGYSLCAHRVSICFRQSALWESGSFYLPIRFAFARRLKQLNCG